MTDRRIAQIACVVAALALFVAWRAVSIAEHAEQNAFDAFDEADAVRIDCHCSR